MCALLNARAVSVCIMVAMAHWSGSVRGVAPRSTRHTSCLFLHFHLRPSRRMHRLGLVGIGDAGKHHARVLALLHREGVVEWSAVCVRRPEALEKLRQDIDLPKNLRVYPTIDELLAAGDCNALVLATPDGLHAEHVEKAAAQSVAVLVEKPLAFSAEAARKALESAKHANVHIQVAYHLRYHRAHEAMVVRQGEHVGRIRSIFIRWAWPDPAKDGWRARGVQAPFWSLAALGTHAIDLAMFFAQSTEISNLVALREPTTGVDHAAEVSFVLGKGVLVHISTSILHRAVSRVFLVGDKGEWEATATLGARGAGDLVYRAAGKPIESTVFDVVNPYEMQLRDFVRRVSLGFQPDPSLLANVSVLEDIAAFSLGRMS